METIQFKLNGKPVTVRVDGDRMLLWVLRTDLDVTGPKYGCGEGLCGTCTVLIDNEAVRSCQTPISDVKGVEVVTIEGLGNEEDLHPLQKAFIEHDALQCGFCTPGMILSAKYLLDRNPSPSDSEIREGIAGNFCRCTGYTKIIESISAAAQATKRRGK